MEANYRKVKGKFEHPISRIGEVHNKVLNALVEFPTDIFRLHLSFDKVPLEIMDSKY